MGTAIMEHKRVRAMKRPVQTAGKAPVKTPESLKRKINNLAEAIILQSLEDLYEASHREESLEFFRGEGFRICTEIAGIAPEGKFQLKSIAGKIK